MKPSALAVDGPFSLLRSLPLPTMTLADYLALTKVREQLYATEMRAHRALTGQLAEEISP
jgi:hypothetical protein